MRIVLEATPNYLNMGDVAMLKVALRRLRSLWPDAEIRALTADVQRLRRHCPDVHPLFVGARELWYQSVNQGVLPHLIWQYRAEPIERRLIHQFLTAIERADLFLMVGMGSITSTFEPSVLSMVETLRLAKSRGARVLMLGQGLGPIVRGDLWNACREILPRVDLIALREQRSGSAILRELEAPEPAVTGDDAIELAYRRDADPAQSALLGVSLRVAGYSRVAPESAAVIIEELSGLGHPMSGLPTCFGEGEYDPEAVRGLMAEDPVPDGDSATPERVIEAIGGVRVLVTGIYHAAVFALSQGIPVVALAMAEYYRDKFLGLAGQFGCGCTVVDLAGSGWAAQMKAAVEGYWDAPATHRVRLLDAAARQMDAGLRLYASLPERFPDLKKAGARQDPVDEAEMDEHIHTWHQYRIRQLETELRKTVDYLREVEAERDRQTRRADRSEANLQQVARLVGTMTTGAPGASPSSASGSACLWPLPLEANIDR